MPIWEDPVAEASVFIYKETFSINDDLICITTVGKGSATVLAGPATQSGAGDFQLTLGAGQSMIV